MTSTHVPTEPSEGAAVVRNALVRLESLDPRRAYIARLRVIGRLSNDQIAFLLGLEEATVVNYWRFARAWLAREVHETFL